MPIHHLLRVLRVGIALVKLGALRSRWSAVWLSVDAGYGIHYTAVLTVAARLMRYGVILDHHSYAYVRTRSGRMAWLVTLAGRTATHVFKCDQARTEFRRVYGTLQTVTVGAWYAAAPSGPHFRRHARSHDALPRLGHLSNLSIAKGLIDTLEFADIAVRSGLAESLTLAGPIRGSAAHSAIRDAVARGYVSYIGPVADRRRESFFQNIEVFLFMSTYEHELAPLVVSEAMLRGVPVIARETGCFRRTHLAAGGVWASTKRALFDAGLAQLRKWSEDREDLDRAGQAAFSQASAEYRLSIEQLFQFVDEVS